MYVKRGKMFQVGTCFTNKIFFRINWKVNIQDCGSQHKLM